MICQAVSTFQNSPFQLFTKQKLKLDLQEQAKAFSATVDMWTSVTGDLYLSYTTYCINVEWELKTKCLQTLYFPTDHT